MLDKLYTNYTTSSRNDLGFYLPLYLPLQIGFVRFSQDKRGLIRRSIEGINYSHLSN
jgi:hypothetical protein